MKKKFDLNNLKIRDKLIIYFICLIILPISLIFLFTYTKLSNIVQDKISNYSSVIIRGVCNEIDQTLTNMTDSKYYMLSNDDIQNILEKQNNSDVDILHEDATFILNNLISILSSKEYVTSITIYNNKGQTFFYSNILADKPYDYNEIVSSEHYDDLLKANGKLVQYGFDKSRNAYTLGMQYLSKNELKQIGIIVINIDMTAIEKIFDKSNVEKSGKFYIIDTNGEIIFHTDKNMIGKNEDAYRLAILNTSNRYVLSTKVENTDLITITYPSDAANWRYVYTVPKKDLMYEIITIRNFMIAVFGSGVILAIIFAVIISFGVARPIKNLITQMDKAEMGNLDVRVSVKSKDEIGLLSEKFNTMIENIQTLINSVYKQELMRKNAEIEALQAQINPHFLYNTLDSINALAELRGVDEISKITVAFSKLLRASISNEQNIISLEEEFSYINNYITIIKIRYNNRIDFIMDLQKETLECLLPKLIVQPIVENAVIHGLDGKPEDCQVVMKGWIENNTLYIQISDNGEGMDINELEKKSIRKRYSGVGLSNVRKRIELLYGNSYGVKIESKKNVGTTVTLKIPVNYFSGENM